MDRSFAALVTLVAGVGVMGWGTPMWSGPATAHAQTKTHGGEIQKSCTPASVPVGSPLSCNITLTNTDTFNDTLRVDSIGDLVKHASGPASADLLMGPATVADLKGGCFTGDRTTAGQFFFLGSPSPGTLASSFSCSSDADCAGIPPANANGVCITGACVGGLNNTGFCRSTPSCEGGGTCTSAGAGIGFGTCSGGSTSGRRCCDCPGGTCQLGACSSDLETDSAKSCCVGGANDGSICCECPGGTCAQGECVGGTAPAHTACTNDAACPGGMCSLLLPRQASVTVSATDIALANDVPTLVDVATGQGNDLGTLRPFVLEINNEVTVSSTTSTTLPAGCRITGGGTVNGVLDPNVMAEITKAQFAGQVGAPCGCFGCFDKFDPKLASVQGEWSHKRKNKGGSLHANTFNSLVCSCLGGPAGELCPDAAPPRTPADHICITGTGQFVPETGKKDPIPVAFRFEATDRGEPGSNDFYEMHMFTPTAAGQTVEDIAKAICCTKPPVFPITGVIANDSGLLVGGNIQIHRALAKSTDGPCPPPSGVCMPIAP